MGLRSRRPLALTTLLAVSWICAASWPVRSQQSSEDKAAIPLTTEGASRWALVVGIDTYQSLDITPLSGAVADANAIKGALVKYAEFPESQVILLTSDGAEKPTAVNLMEKLASIRASVKPTDLMLFFFAGHGVQVEGQRYMLTFDAKIGSTAQIKISSLPARTLMQELESIKVAHRVVMIDACRNDPTARGDRPNVVDEGFEAAFTLKSAGEDGVRATFLSSSKGQSAYEWGEKGRGFFSYFIEQGLCGAAAIRGKVTFTSLIDYLNEFVPQAVREWRNREQIPYTKFEGPPYVLVRPAKITTQASGLDQKPAPPRSRTVYGVVKDSAGSPVAGASIRLDTGTSARGSPDAGGRTVTTDEDGFFRVEGVSAVDGAAVTATKPGFLAKTVASPAEEAGKKVVVFLARSEPEVAMVVPPSEVATTRTVEEAPGTTAVPPEQKPPAIAASTVRMVPVDIETPAAAPGTTVADPGKAVTVQSEPIIVPPASAKELTRVAYQFFLAENFREAEITARAALGADSADAAANAVLGNALAVLGVNNKNAKLVDEARPFVKTALELNPADALAHNGRALTLVHDGNLDEAQKELNKAIKLDPRLAPAHANLALTYQKTERLKEAETEYREAIRLQPDNAVPYNGLSAVLFERKRYKDSVKACRDAISRYPIRDGFLGLFYVQLATAQYQMGRQEQALDAVSRAKALGVTENPAVAIIEKVQSTNKD